MQKSVKSKAEEKFAASLRKDKQAIDAREKAERDLVARMARQRSQRLAKEAALKLEEAEKPTAKKKPARAR